MKKFLSMFFVFALVLSSVTCLATDEGNNSQDYNWYENYSGETEYLNDYSEYQDLINSMDEQTEYKKLYEQMITETIDSYNKAKRDEIYKAKVLEASEPQTYYGYYQYLYRSVYQVVKVEILNGPYKGKVVEDVNYILTGDTYGNLQLPKVTEGMTINVSATLDEKGDLYAYSSSIDSPVTRWGWVVALIAATIILVIISAGKPGMKMLVPVLLLVDLLVMVMIPSMFSGTNIMLLLGIVIILSTITICVLKLGIGTKTFVAILVTLIMNFMLVLLIYGFDSLAYFSGITYEITNLVETILPRVVDSEVVPAMDLHALNVAIIAIMAFFASTPIVCKTIDLYDSKKSEDKPVANTINEMKEYVSDKLGIIIPVLFTLTIPKFMILIINKCSLAEIVNSEVLGSDVVRILFIVISMTLAAPITACAGKLLIDDDKSEEN